MIAISFVLVFFISCFIYKRNYDYFKPLEYTSPETSKKVSVHSLYPEFAAQGDLSFFRILIGYLTIAFPKLLINIFFAAMQNIQLKKYMKSLKNLSSDPEEWKLVSKTISLWTSLFLKVNGIKIKKLDLPYEEIYRKYLGEDYSFNPDEKYSLLISNHTGFYDVIINMAIHSSGFMAKTDTKNYPFVGEIAQGINCLFVNRKSEADRAKVFKQLEEKQKNFYEGKDLAPLMLFPEGTTTNGKYLLKFKKGAFYSLLPIKPQVLLIDDNINYSIACGVSSAAFNYFRSLCYFGCDIGLCELPVIKPTEFMFEHYSDLGKEKWEIFAEVTRKIMCEISGLKPSDKNYRNIIYYEKSLYKGVYKDESKVLIPKE